jgi:Ca2+-binding RTX toxin-like protein
MRILMLKTILALMLALPAISLGAAPAAAAPAEVEIDSNDGLEVRAPADDTTAHQITVKWSGSTLRYTITDTAGLSTSDPACMAADATTVTCDGAFVDTVHVAGGAGDDEVTLASVGPIDNPEGFFEIGAAGGEGDDVVRSQQPLQHANLAGGYGDDRVFGGPGADRLTGGDGTDVVFGGAARDHLEGDKGGDRIGGGSGRDLVLGQDGGDVLIGGGGTDKMHGGAGIDHLRARDGQVDYLACGAGSPALQSAKRDRFDRRYRGRNLHCDGNHCWPAPYKYNC